ncbi:hypothetical protein [Dongia sp.]|uniref:hypothetical protein n=1 Tax=Dongia sp. TaxID=1977262 RepID=UPI0037509631
MIDERAHRQLMQLSATSRVATADASEFRADPAAATDGGALALSDMLEMGLEALLSQFRRR